MSTHCRVALVPVRVAVPTGTVDSLKVEDATAADVWSAVVHLAAENNRNKAHVNKLDAQFRKAGAESGRL